MRRYLLASVAALAFGIGAATAADLRPSPAPIYTKAPPPPVWSWTGFYVGGNVGGVEANSKEGWLIDPANQADAPGAIAAREALSSQTLKSASAIGGVQAGYNWQFGPGLVGIESDFDWEHPATTSFSPTLAPLFGAPGDGNNLTQSVAVNWLSTTRGRLGFVWDRMLFYGTGGLAVGNVHFFDSSHYAAGVTETASVTTTRTGWVAGAGLEYAFAHNWSLKAEYLHVDLGSDTTYSSLSPAFAVAYFHDHSLTEDIGRIGVNYSFH